MGLKSKSKQINNFKIGGLLFDSEEDYKLFEKENLNTDIVVILVKNKIWNIKDYYNRIKNINVRETYYNASEELDGLFDKATALLCYEDTPYTIEYKVGCSFFDKINIIKYTDTDIDIDSDINIDSVL